MPVRHAFLLVISLTACAHIRELQTQRLRDKFQDQFACEAVEVTEPAQFDGPQEYRIQGCEQVAFYSCETASQQSVCILEHHRPLSVGEAQQRQQREARAAQEAERAAKAGRDRRAAESDFASTRAGLAAHPAQALGELHADDWRLQLSRVAATHVLLHFATQRLLAPAPCLPTITGDGHVITTEAIAAHPEHEADFLVRASDLRDLANSQIVRGAICGVDFRLDEGARQSLRALLEAPALQSEAHR